MLLGSDSPPLRSLKLALSVELYWTQDAFTLTKIPTHLPSNLQHLQHLALITCAVDWTELQLATNDHLGFQNLLTLHLERVKPASPTHPF